VDRVDRVDKSRVPSPESKSIFRFHRFYRQFIDASPSRKHVTSAITQAHLPHSHRSLLRLPIPSPAPPKLRVLRVSALLNPAPPSPCSCGSCGSWFLSPRLPSKLPTAHYPLVRLAGSVRNQRNVASPHPSAVDSS
jgi:hypothetical protein